MKHFSYSVSLFLGFYERLMRGIDREQQASNAIGGYEEGTIGNGVSTAVSMAVC